MQGTPNGAHSSHVCTTRLLLQYYDDSFPVLKDQLKFEESLFQKTQRANGRSASHCWCPIYS